MSIKIRLARGGSKKRPHYRMVIADARSPRDGDFIERVGYYNPLIEQGKDGRLSLNNDRISYWLGQGAQPTDRVVKFITSAGIELPEHIKKKVDIKQEAWTSKLSKKELKKASK